MNEDDEVLVAWLNARDLMVVRDMTTNQMFLRPRYVTAFEHGPVETKHLDMWVQPSVTALVSNVQLFAEQRGKRRPLRGVVREWLLGL